MCAYIYTYIYIQRDGAIRLRLCMGAPFKYMIYASTYIFMHYTDLYLYIYYETAQYVVVFLKVTLNPSLG